MVVLGVIGVVEVDAEGDGHVRVGRRGGDDHLLGPRLEVLGTGGVMILDDDHTDQLMYSETGVPHVYLPDHVVNMVFLQSGTPGDWALGEFWGPIANETRAWLDHLATGRPCTLATPQEARATLEATLAIEHSMRIGMPVTLPLRAG